MVTGVELSDHHEPCLVPSLVQLETLDVALLDDIELLAFIAFSNNEVILRESDVLKAINELKLLELIKRI